MFALSLFMLLFSPLTPLYPFQEISSDLLLRRYSVLLLDEAHERNLNTDVLLGLLSRALPLRNQIAREEQARFVALGEEEKAKTPLPLRYVFGWPCTYTQISHMSLSYPQTDTQMQIQIHHTHTYSVP